MSQALVNESPLLIYPQLAAKMGLNEAIILQQIHYWLDAKRTDHFYENRYWVHNTYDEWAQQFPFWASRTIQRTIFRLEEMGVLLSHLSRDFKKTKFYTIDYDRLDRYIESPQTPAKDKDSSPSCHSELIVSSSCPLPGQNDVMEDNDNTSQTQSLVDQSPSGQSDHEMRTICPRSRQDGTIHHDKVARSYIPYTETTTETTLPPLTPPSSVNLCLRQEDEETLQIMFRVWDERVYQVLCPGKHLHLTQERKAQMHQILEGLFDSNLEAWKDYCTTIAACPFLMGQNEKNFRVTLDWALTPKNTLKVLEGDFYSQTAESTLVVEQPWDEYVPVLKAALKNWPYAEEWLQVCEALVKHLGQVTFNVWFRQVRPKEITNTSMVLLVPNAFTKDYIFREYISDLKICITATYPLNTSFSIEVDANIVTNTSIKPIKGETHE